MKAIDVLAILLNKLKNLGHLKFKRVDTLPHPGEDNIIYLVPRDAGGYEYYIYISDNDEYEDLGNTNIDLTQYATSANLQSEINARTLADTSLLEAVNAESLRAQGVEEDLQGILNAQTLALEDVSSSLTELENEMGDLDVCIEEHLYGNGESGYRKYNGGMLIQWGVATSNPGGEQDFTMHTTNKDQLFSIFVTPREMGNFYSYGYPRANNKFACRIQNRDSQSMAIKFQWLSIGRWK